ncbi:uncharacterized protein BT62DRAFT_1034743 [Guyanagaster necrorhizus]|uniref:Uncharacterized protein n=1 Tax=Guyanagaster necrorhizus TaxID=856835 RepID=A0A9P8APZ9_9AGAR|nr:uncharacterized protein BT62DRAFT_1034743 [Guyanagaster necrorhizus MCA 3950]KAG7443301.1 hypothetical protein BT62DRAFT_1034743 [Guyanagaster necrorhizus MCA 3950]
MSQDRNSLDLRRLNSKARDSYSTLGLSPQAADARPVLLRHTYNLFNLASVLGLALIIPVFIATLIYLLLKPISDIISDAGSGIGIAASKAGLGLEIVLKSLWTSSVGVVSGVVSIISSSSFKDSPSHPRNIPTFPTELSRELFCATTNMTLRINAQATLYSHVGMLQGHFGTTLTVRGRFKTETPEDLSQINIMSSR